MPELPEVEVVKNDLAATFASSPIIREIKFFRNDLRSPLPHKKAKSLAGARVLGVFRRAKYIIIQTTQGDIISHLGMTGNWQYHLLSSNTKKTHEHIHVYLSDKSYLSYSDTRRFGYFDICKDWLQHKKFLSLGLEPLAEELDVQQLFTKIRARSASIKSVIMDQKVVVGVGNIYAAEALFKAGIRPMRKANKVKEAELAVLFEEVRKILRAAILAGGSTISDFHHSHGEGQFQNSHLVYGREGLPCVVCGGILRNTAIGNRSSFWCPKCQQ